LHGKQAGCACRKPEPGLFLQAFESFTCDCSKTFFIGDKLSDVEAGQRVGLKTILVLTGHGTLEKEKITDTLQPDCIKKDLADAVSVVLNA